MLFSTILVWWGKIMVIISRMSAIPFDVYHPEIEASFQEITRFVSQHEDVRTLHIEPHLEQLISYTVPGGKHLRCVTAMHIHELLMTKAGKPVDLKLASVVGLCCEIVCSSCSSYSSFPFHLIQIHSAFLIADDIIDNSETRRGKPCWYKRPEVSFLSLFYLLQLLVSDWYSCCE
jgi:farnesyl diphosphate synthase